MTRHVASIAAIAIMLAACACSSDRNASRSDPVVRLGAQQVPSATTGVGRAPAFAVSPDGAEAMIWVSAPEGGTNGRLQILRGDRLSEFSDSLGPIEAHDEAPPKLAFGADSSTLNILYVVGRVEEGRRFPLAALRFIRSTDAGATWSTPVTITDDSEFGSHNFHALHVARDGSIHASWLDGRNGVSNVYVASSSDSGRTWATNKRVYAGEACPCCRTAMASDSRGNLFLSWRTVMPGNIRDIVISRSSDAGVTWTEPERVHADNWEFPGCPHAGPALQVGDDDRLHITWWTGKPGRAGVFYAHSDDAAASWSKPVDIGVAEFARPSAVQMALPGSNRVLVAWSDGAMEIPSVILRVSNDGGLTFGERITVSEEGRHAFFPLLGARDSTFAVVWSEQSHDYAQQEKHNAPDMSNPDVKKGLSAVGQTSVVMRRGVIGGG